MLTKKLALLIFPVAVFILLNLLINLYIGSEIKLSRYVHNLFEIESDSIDVVVFGNSQPQYAIFFSEFPEIQGLNLALNSQSVDLDYLMFNSFEPTLKQDAIILIHLSFFSFCQNYSGTMLQYRPFFDVPLSFQDKIIEDYLPLFGINRFSSTMSFLNDRTKTNSELDIASQYSLNIEEWISDGQKRYNSHKEIAQCNDDVLQSNLNYIENMVSYNLSKGRDVFFITVPYHHTYFDNLINDSVEYTKFSQRILYLTTKYNIDHLDYSMDLRFYYEMMYFFDWDHMNQFGSKKFTSILLSDLNLIE